LKVLGYITFTRSEEIIPNNCLIHSNMKSIYISCKEKRSIETQWVHLPW